jgi:hypothetical protein
MGIINWWRKQNESTTKKQAEEKFQVKEHNNEMWLVHNGELVAPFTLLTKENTTTEMVSFLYVIRQLYIDRCK